jgi:hypothetical protein
VSAHGNIVKCEKCGEVIIAEALGSHRCTRAGTDIRNIPIEYYFEMKSDEGNPVIYARSLAGVVYWLEVIPKSKQKRNQMIALILLTLVAAHALSQVAASPTEFSRPHQTICHTLPYQTQTTRYLT